MEGRSETSITVWVGMLLYVGAGVLVLLGGLIMPIWAVVLLGAVWVVGLLLALVWRRSRPWLVLLLPFLSVGLWFLTAWIGDTFLDWTA